MNINEAAEAIARELTRNGFLPSDGRTIAPWDRVFFGKPAPAATRERPCVCGGTLRYADGAGYLTGQWQCDLCTRLLGATVAETIGALRKQVVDAGAVH